jgi:heterodisulfide reductase subunit A
VAQAGAAAAETMALIDKGVVELEAYTAWITEERCSGCQICVPLCPFSAIEFNKDKKVSQLNEALCKGCGTCVAACPSHAAQQHHFTDTQIMAEIEGVLVS